MDLLEECLQLLGNDSVLITGADKRKVDIEFDSLYVKDNLGRIDWSLYYKSREVED